MTKSFNLCYYRICVQINKQGKGPYSRTCRCGSTNSRSNQFRPRSCLGLLVSFSALLSFTESLQGRKPTTDRTDAKRLVNRNENGGDGIGRGMAGLPGVADVDGVGSPLGLLGVDGAMEVAREAELASSGVAFVSTRSGVIGRSSRGARSSGGWCRPPLPRVSCWPAASSTAR
jgi:hypothetical protein